MRIIVDPQLARLAYRCWPDGCPRDRTCCVGLVVAVSSHEIRAIDSLMDELARVVPALRGADGFGDVFARDDDGWQIEPRDERGTCPFLLVRGGRALCAVHDLALRTGRAIAAVKPRACRHWPLVVEARGAGVRISIHPEAETMGCVAPCAALPGQPSVRDAFAAEIAELRRLVR
jgi:hypothetical protein